MLGILIASIILPSSYSLYKRKKKRKFYYKVVWKKSSSLKPTDVLGERGEFKYGFNDYYSSRKEDVDIKKRIEDHQNVLLIGQELSGKTRSIYQILKTLEKPCNVIIPNQVDIKPEELIIPIALCFWRNKLFLLDDLDRFAKKVGFKYLFREFLKRKVIIIATCSSMKEYVESCSELTDVSVFGEPIELSTFSRKDAEEIAKKVGKPKLALNFDGNLSLIFPELSVARKPTSIVLEKSMLFKVRTIDEFYEVIQSGNFLEQPLDGRGEWIAKKKSLISFNQELVQKALTELDSHRILLITGPPKIGKTTFMLSFLDDCIKAKRWKAIIFLNPVIGQSDLNSVLEEIDALIIEHGQDNVILAIDGLRQWEKSDNYVNKCRELFLEASKYRYRLIATLHESEKDFLRKKLQPPESNSNEWGKIDPTVIKVEYTTQELERILVSYLNFYKEKIKLEGISFEEMNSCFLGETILAEKKENCQKFKNCLQSAVRKSEGLAGYLAFFVKEISEHELVLTEEVVEKYPIGMVNLILNTIHRDYYTEKDKLIPLLMVLLTKLEYPSKFSLTKHFFNSFITWGIKELDETLGKEEREEIQEKIDNFKEFYISHVTFMQEYEYTLLDYWRNAIDDAIYKGKFDKNYAKVVDGLKEAENYWKYWIDHYLSYTKNELKSHFHPDMLYLVGDLAKLGFITDINFLDFATEFLKEKQDSETTLSSRLNYLKKTLSLLWRIKAEYFVASANYNDAINFYKKAIEIDNVDHRAYWEIGECYTKNGEERKALNWYVESAKRQDTSRGYGSLISKIVNYCKKNRLLLEDKLRFIEIQEEAAKRAVECGRNEHITLGMLGEALRQEGNILKIKGKYTESIDKFEAAIKSFKKAIELKEKLELPQKGYYYREIGYCHLSLNDVCSRLGKTEAENHLQEAKTCFKKEAEIDDSPRGKLKFAKEMAKFFGEDNSACTKTLEKINVEQLKVEDLIDYYWICGLNYKNRTEIDNALNCFEKTKGLILSSFSGRMITLIDSVYQQIGNCYEKTGNYGKASENYITYLDLNEYTLKGLSGKLFGIYGDKLVGMGLYAEAHYCFRRALKRDPTNIRNLREMAIVNERLGQLESAISNMENVIKLRRLGEITGRRLLPEIEKDEEELKNLRRKLEKKKQIEQVLKEICAIADSSEAVNRGEKMVSDLSTMWYNVKLLLDGISPSDVDSDLSDLKISALCQSYNLNSRNSAAIRELEELLVGTKIDEAKNEYHVKYHIARAQETSHMKTPLLEVFHRIFCTVINTTTVDNLIKKGKLKGYEKQQRTYSLSEEWGKTGRRISIGLAGSSHEIPICCFELSIKINPENTASWLNLGWAYFYDSIKCGKPYDLVKLDKASEAFTKTLRLDDKGERKYSALSTIGIGKICEAKGDAVSAANLFKESVDLTAKDDSQKTIDLLVKTAVSLRDLRFLELSKDDEINFLRAALDLYKKALEISERIEPLNIQTNLLKEKVILFESQIKVVVEKTLPVDMIKAKRSLDEILSAPFQSEQEKLEHMASQMANQQQNYESFKQLFEDKFGYLKISERSLINNLDKIVGTCLKQTEKGSSFEASSKVFEFCQAFCRELYGEGGRRELINVFNERMPARFSKIVLGIEYKLGPIESQTELALLMNEFGSAFGKLGARVPSMDEIDEAIRIKKRKRGQKV